MFLRIISIIAEVLFCYHLERLSLKFCCLDSELIRWTINALLSIMAHAWYFYHSQVHLDQTCFVSDYKFLITFQRKKRNRLCVWKWCHLNIWHRVLSCVLMVFIHLFFWVGFVTSVSLGKRSHWYCHESKIVLSVGAKSGELVCIMWCFFVVKSSFLILLLF